MPILDFQRRLQEVGRIRIGRQVESRGGKKRPAALDTFRLTSPDRARIAAAAELYGGTVTTWQSPSGREEFEVITKTDRLPVLVPPSAMAFSQWMEQWSAGGCQRRCDGVTDQISDQPCVCNPESPACEPHTRLSVMLRDVRGLGLFRLDTQGYYAAVELQGAVEIISLAAGKGGQMLPATLRLEQRSVKRADEQVKRFVVPVLDIDVTPAQLLMGVVSVEPQQSPRPALTPVPDGGPPPSIADQVKSASDVPSRRRASTPSLPSTGIVPRTAAQVAGQMGPDKWSPLPFEHERDTTGEETQDPPKMVTKAQLTKLAVSLRERGFDDDSPAGKTARLEWCSKIVNRRLNSATELTFDEAKKVIDFLKKPAEATQDDTAVEAEVQSEAQSEVEPEEEGEQIGLHLAPPGEGTCTTAAPTNRQCNAIIKLYEAKKLTGAAVLEDITQFLQSEEKVASLHSLTTEQADAVIKHLEG